MREAGSRINLSKIIGAKNSKARGAGTETPDRLIHYVKTPTRMEILSRLLNSPVAMTEPDLLE